MEYKPWLDPNRREAPSGELPTDEAPDGHKTPLGFIETTTENAEAVGDLLQDLNRRGLDFSQGLLCVVDGAKGLYKAIRDVLGECVVVQRCQWHKRENVVSYLNESHKDAYRGKLQRAWALPN